MHIAVQQGASPGQNTWWTQMASAGRKPIMGVWGRSPQRGPGAEPFSFWVPNRNSKFASFSAVCKFPKPQAFVIYLSKKTEWVVHDGTDPPPTPPPCNKKLSCRRGTARCVVSVKSCQWPCNSAETTLRQVLNKSKLWSWRVKVGRCVIKMCTQPWRVRVAFIVL